MSVCRRIFGILVAGVAMGAYWHAHHPETIEGISEALDFGAASTTPPMVRVFHINWSADGKSLLSYAKFAGGDIRLTLHDASTNGSAESIELPGSIVSAALVRGAHQVVVGTISGELVRIDLESFEKTFLEESAICGSVTPETFCSVAVTDDGRLVAAANNSGLIRLYEPARPHASALVSSLQAEHESSVTTLRFSSDGTRVVAARNDGSIQVWDVVAGKRLRVFHEDGKPVTAASLSPDGQRIVAAESDSIRIWEVASGKEIWRAQCGIMGVTAMALSRDGKSAACGSAIHKIIVWDIDYLCKTHEITTPCVIINDLEFSPDGERLAASGVDEAIRIYDTQTGAELERLKLENFNRF